MSFTPGPWVAIKPTQANGRAEVYAGNVLVAQSFNWMQDSTGEDYCRADARLIAAAPLMYEALRTLLICYSCDGEPQDTPAWKRAHAALKQADPDVRIHPEA